MLPIDTPYALGGANEPISLYRGAGTLRRSDGNSVSGPTALDFALLPSPRLAFQLEAALPPEGSKERLSYTLSLDEAEGFPPLNVFARRVRFGTPHMDTAGTAEAVITEPRTVDRMVFLLTNWPAMFGDFIHDPGGSGGWRGRVTLESNGWRVVLESRRDIRTLIEDLQTSGGFAVTHLGSLERLDGASFGAAEGHSFMDCLAYFFGFARGLWTPPTLVVGIESGRLVWREWSGRITSPWRANFSWFSADQPEMLSDVFSGFVNRWEDPDWQEPLLLGVSWLVEANPSDPAERSIVVAQVALELMEWLILVRDEGVMTVGEWNAGRDKARRHLRRLLSHAGIPTAIPENLSELVNLAQSETWDDGPDALVGFRNRLVHPRDRSSAILATPVMARVQLAELASWYCELALLYFCGHRGGYLNRNTLTVERVPWA